MKHRRSLKRGSMILALGVVAFLWPGGASGPTAAAVEIPVPPLEASFSGKLSPANLPGDGDRIPVAATVEGSFSTADETHLPALRSAVLDLDRGISIDTQGLPKCAAKTVSGRLASFARRVCRTSVVGRGAAMVAIEGEGSSRALLTIFNAEVDGRTPAFLLHIGFPSGKPAPRLGRVLVSPITAKVPPGLRTRWEIPRLLGGRGSIAHFELRFDRMLLGDPDRAFLSASCLRGRQNSHLLARLKDEVGTGIGLQVISASIISDCAS